MTKLKKDQYTLPTKSDVGLGNVDNTADASKPVSTAAQTALDAKVSKGTLVFNVKDYGATGDGSTNDTTNVQSAITAAGAVGGVVFFPVGTYMVDPLTAGYDHITLRGTGRSSMVKLRSQNLASDSAFAVIEMFGTSPTPIRNVTIEFLGVDGNYAGMTNQGSRTVDMECINFKYVINGTVRNCYIRNSTSDGIDLDDSSRCIVVNNHCYDNNGSGIHISENTVRCIVKGNYCETNGTLGTRSGIDQYTSASDNLFSGNICHGNYRNYNIEGTGAQFINNLSTGTTTAVDVFTGIKGGGVMQGTRRITTGTVEEAFTQSGWGYIEGNATAAVTQTLTFPVAYTELTSLVLTRIGNPGTTIPTTIHSGGGMSGNVGEFIGWSGGSGTSVTVQIGRSTGTYATGNYYMYAWVATGKK